MATATREMKCRHCQKPLKKHCDECRLCPGEHTTWCPNHPDAVIVSE